MKEFNTLVHSSLEYLYKAKGSKFYGYAHPISSTVEAEGFLKQLKIKHPNAKHYCYAYQIGVEKISYRSNDDGEPNNSAGAPIYGQIKSLNLTNVIVVIVRYFGGTKLGISGLIEAYKNCARDCLKSTPLKKVYLTEKILLKTTYASLDKLLKIIKTQKIKIVSKKIENECVLEISIKKDNKKNLLKALESIQILKNNILTTNFMVFGLKYILDNVLVF